MDATNVVTSTDTVGRGYHHQGHPAHQTTIIHEADIRHALSTWHTDVMTEEVGADPMLGCTRETEAQVDQDTPAQTDTLAEIGTQVKDTHLTATEPRAVRLTDRDRVITDHLHHTPGTILGVGLPHATAKNHIDVV